MLRCARRAGHDQKSRVTTQSSGSSPERVEATRVHRAEYKAPVPSTNPLLFLKQRSCCVPAAATMPVDAELADFHARLWESGGHERGAPLEPTVVDLGPTRLQKWAAQYVEWAGLLVAVDNVRRQHVKATDVDVIILTTEEEFTEYRGMAFDVRNVGARKLVIK